MNCYSQPKWDETSNHSVSLWYTLLLMGVGVVNHTLNIDSRLSELFCLSECLDYGAGQRGSDNRGWTVLATCICKGQRKTTRGEQHNQGQGTPATFFVTYTVVKAHDLPH